MTKAQAYSDGSQFLQSKVGSLTWHACRALPEREPHEVDVRELAVGLR